MEYGFLFRTNGAHSSVPSAAKLAIKRNVWKRYRPPIPPPSRIFGYGGLRWQTYLHFVSYFAAESAGRCFVTSLGLVVTAP